MNKPEIAINMAPLTVRRSFFNFQKVHTNIFNYKGLQVLKRQKSANCIFNKQYASSQFSCIFVGTSQKWLKVWPGNCKHLVVQRSFFNFQKTRTQILFANYRKFVQRFVSAKTIEIGELYFQYNFQASSICRILIIFVWTIQKWLKVWPGNCKPLMNH